NAAVVGFSFGTMIGSAILRDANGNFLVNGAGSYQVDNSFDFSDDSNFSNIIGDANPDFTFNISNQISYKNFNLGIYSIGFKEVTCILRLSKLYWVEGL
ncbi:MAG: hypothetical protein HRT70_08715, partial [Flavobacteriaceae bacterium]|nr:hypothetical protein [Flavobacteriaceae bacterium]